MLASNGEERARQVRIGADGSVDHVAPLGGNAVPKHSRGHVVLHFASVRTGMAANATLEIDGNSQFRHGSHLKPFALPLACR